MHEPDQEEELAEDHEVDEHMASGIREKPRKQDNRDEPEERETNPWDEEPDPPEREET